MFFRSSAAFYWRDPKGFAPNLPGMSDPVLSQKKIRTSALVLLWRLVLSHLGSRPWEFWGQVVQTLVEVLSKTLEDTDGPPQYPCQNYPWPQRNQGCSERVIVHHCSVIRSCKKMLIMAVGLDCHDQRPVTFYWKHVQTRKITAAHCCCDMLIYANHNQNKLIPQNVQGTSEFGVSVLL